MFSVKERFVRFMDLDQRVYERVHNAGSEGCESNLTLF